MRTEELITKQQLQIEEQKQEIAALRESIRMAKAHIYCIGGPLNDNKLGYSKAQMVTFAQIAKELDAV